MTSPRSNKPKSAEIAARGMRVVELKMEGKTFQEIADELGVSIGTVHADFNRSIDKVVEPAVTEYRARQGAELTTMKETVLDVIRRRHVAISDGRIVHDAAGDPIADDGPLLAAVDRLVKIQDREAKLYGLDARPEVQITGTLAYEVLGFGVSGGENSQPGPG